jgi:hypothetical protein
MNRVLKYYIEKIEALLGTKGSEVRRRTVLIESPSFFPETIIEMLERKDDLVVRILKVNSQLESMLSDRYIEVIAGLPFREINEQERNMLNLPSSIKTKTFNYVAIDHLMKQIAALEFNLSVQHDACGNVRDGTRYCIAIETGNKVMTFLFHEVDTMSESVANAIRSIMKAITQEEI